MKRTRLLLLVLLALALFAGACGTDGDSAADTTEDSDDLSDHELPTTEAVDGWSYTDDTGTTVELDQAPTRIAALTDVASAFISYGIDPVATFGYSAIEDDIQFEGLDTVGVTQVGTTYGEINLEALADTEPEIIVTSRLDRGS